MGVVDHLTPLPVGLDAHLGQQCPDRERIQRLPLSLRSRGSEFMQVIGHTDRNLAHASTVAALIAVALNREPALSVDAGDVTKRRCI